MLNGVGSAATQAFTLTVNQAPAIGSAGSTTFSAGTVGTFNVTATGFPTPVLSESGALPVGVTFNPATGVLSGTPAAGSGNTYGLTFKATSAAGTATQSFTLIVHETPGITSANNTAFSVSTPGTFTVTTSGFPTPALTDANFAGCTISALPSGVTFHDNGNGTATLAGTPAAGTGGSYTLCVNASNSVGSTATQTFVLTVKQGPIITSASVATFTAGIPGSFNVTTTGFPAPALTNVNFSGCTRSPLPSGVTFSDNGDGMGTVAGTPATGTSGSYTVCLNASNPSGTATQTFTLTVVAQQAAAITSASSTMFIVGTSGTFTVTSTGRPLPVLTNSAFGGCTPSALPTGVTFADNGNGTGTLSGTPPTGSAGPYTLCLSAANGVGSGATQTYTLAIDQAPSFVTAASTTFTEGASNSFTVNAGGIPAATYAVTQGNLPSGVTLTSAGVLSGVPGNGTGNPNGKTYNVTITATNAAGTANQSFTLTVIK